MVKSDNDRRHSKWTERVSMQEFVRSMCASILSRFLCISWIFMVPSLQLHQSRIWVTFSTPRTFPASWPSSPSMAPLPELTKIMLHHATDASASRSSLIVFAYHPSDTTSQSQWNRWCERVPLPTPNLLVLEVTTSFPLLGHPIKPDIE